MSPCFPKDSNPQVTYAAYKSVSDVRRGDVIVFRTGNQGQVSEVAWRVIGLPSDHVVVDQTVVSVNDRPLNRVPATSAADVSLFLESTGDARYCVAYHMGPRPDKLGHFEMRVPPGQFLVLGDDRDKSYDSRFIGSVPFDAIVAKFDEPGCSCPESK